MTTVDEQCFYQEVAQRAASLEGAVIDLGCWMGSTAISLARGARAAAPLAAHEPDKVIAFDRFVWEPWMDQFAHLLTCKYCPGDSFLPEARSLVHSAADNVDLVPCDLAEYCWAGGPIKVLLVDAMKTLPLSRQITRTFFPALVPGGVLIHQDFKHFYTSWIHLLQYRLKDHFEFYHETPVGGTVAFRLVKEIGCGLASEVMGEAMEPPLSDVDRAFEHSLSLVSDTGKPPIAAAHVMHFVHLGKRAEALRQYDLYIARGYEPSGELQIARQRLDAIE